MKIFKNIDEYFYRHTKKDLIYSILGSVLLVGFILIYFVYPKSKQFEIESQKKYNTIINKLNQTKIQINVFQIQRVKLLNNYKMAGTELVNLKKQQSFYQELVNLLDFARFNRQKWANYVKNLIFDAKNSGLNIKVINNKIFDADKNNTKLKSLPKGLIVKKMSIGVDLLGDYKSFIHYIYKYENTKDLIRIESIKIKPKNNYYVKFVLYGYEK